MNRKRILLLIVLITFCFGMKGVNKERKALVYEKLSFMLGTWQGEAWSMSKIGKQYAQTTEKVECKLDCAIFTVEGLGRMTDSTNEEGQVVHEAFGIIYKAQGSDTIWFQAHKGEGINKTPVEFLSDKKIRWQLSAMGVKIRFTADFSDGVWFETGEMLNGETWIQIMEMKLEKKEKENGK